MADSTVFCPRCGKPLGAVDSYVATSFAPVPPAPQPARVAVKNATAPMDASLGATMLASSSAPIPPTMISNAPPGQQGVSSGPRYVVTPTPIPPAPQQPPPTMHSGQGYAPPPSPYAYGPPPPMGMVAPSYPQPYPMMYPQPQVQGTPGLAVAALVCGLLGWIPLWIGFILCLLAITFGSIVLAQTKSGHPGRGLAITGLVFGLVLLLPAACGL